MRTSRLLVAESYNRRAADYARAADRHVYVRLGRPLVAAIRSAGVKGDGLVLDIAAGSGAVGRHFERCVALDLSVGQLRRNRARQRVGADATRLPFRDGSFPAAVSGFGINHVGNPAMLVREMTRVAEVAAISTWALPEVPYRPKQVVNEVLARRVGHHRSAAGQMLDRIGATVGSAAAVERIMRFAGVEGDAWTVEVEVPWPGIDAYLDYRLTMPTAAAVDDDAGVREELRPALAALEADQLMWRPRLVIAVCRA